MAKAMMLIRYGVAIDACIAGLVAAALAIGHGWLSGALFLALFVTLRLVLSAAEAAAKRAFALGRLQGQLVSISLGACALSAIAIGYLFIPALT
jgi:hypothetical protein